MEPINQWCFACGKENPIGLQLDFVEKDESYMTTFLPRPEHQGYDGIMHGGLISTVLDEVMARYIHKKGHNAVTARLDVRFRHPISIGQQFTAVAKISGRRGNMYEVVAEIILLDGTVAAQGKATIAILEDEKT